jgi:adenosine deaminase
MLDLGLRATVNSDDPAYFGGYLAQNWIETARALSLTRAELVTLAKNSFTGSFLAPDEIARHLADIDDYTAN